MKKFTKFVSSKMNMDKGKIRRMFPALGVKVYGRDLVYLDNAATSQRPQSVVD